LPFRPVLAPFYSASSIDALKKSIAQLEAGHVVCSCSAVMRALH